jgi:hypothetical protein
MNGSREWLGPNAGVGLTLVNVIILMLIGPI